jgi:GT2 family glycosyltransferase
MGASRAFRKVPASATRPRPKRYELEIDHSAAFQNGNDLTRLRTMSGPNKSGPGSGAPVRISVIIPHYEDLRQLSTCLDLLEKQTLDRSDFEIIIADNNSPCGLEAVRDVASGRAQVVLAETKGAGPARNEAVKVASAPALAFIDSDCRPWADWLRSGLEALKEHPIVGGPVLLEPRDPNRATPEEAFDVVFGFNALEFLKTRGFIGSGNLFVRREVFDAVGGFRSGVSEDLEWSRRAVAQGFALAHDPGAIVSHPARHDWAELLRTWDRRTREAYLLTREGRGGRANWILQSWLVLISPVPHVAKVLRCPRLTSWSDRRGAIRVLFRLRWYRFLQAYRVMFAPESRSDAGSGPRRSLATAPDGERR